MKLSLSLAKKIALALVATLLAAVIFLWLALPGIVQSQAEKFVAGKTGHRLSMARPEFSLFALRLRLADLKLLTPQDEPLLSFDELIVDFAAASLRQRALVFDDIAIKAPLLTVEETPAGLNWMPFLDALQSPDTAKQESGLPRFDIRHFTLSGGQVAYADRRRAPGFATRVAPLDITLSDISTLPDDSGKFSISARTSFDAQLALAGEVDLDPLTIAGTLSLQGLQLEQLAPYLKNVLPAPPAGTLALSARYRAGNDGGKLDLAVGEIEAKLAGVRVPLAAEGAIVNVGSVTLKGGNFDWVPQKLGIGVVAVQDVRLELPHSERPLELASITLEQAQVALAERQATVAKLSLTGGGMHVVRGPGGRIHLAEALAALTGSRSSAPHGEAAEQPWRFRLDQLALADMDLMFRDEGVSPAAIFNLRTIALGVEGISENLQAALPAKLSFNVDSGGSFTAAGKLIPAALAADFRLKLDDLALKPAEPYLAGIAALDIAGGRLSAQGRFNLDAKGPAYRGELAVRELRLDAAGTNNSLLAWQSLATAELTATPAGIDIGELRLNGLDTRLIIDKDKNINLRQLFKPAITASGGNAPANASPAAVSPASTFAVNVARLRFYNGSLYFADHSLVLPFGTQIGKLRGSLGNLSSQANGMPGQIELEGEVDDYGMARAAGEADLFDPTGFMDIRVQFRNVEMARLTPYLATFAGRRIDAGKLSLDLQYKLKQRQLQGENQLVIERLTLGERVESPSAKDLPLDLAIAILQDGDGRIDLGLPVSGNLDDPEFSYGAIIWKAIGNVLTKIATAPFRALAGLFGGGEKMETIAFEAGAGKLTPPEREKLARLAAGLVKRPGLLLTVASGFAETDRAVLQDVQLRRTLMGRIGQRVPAETWDPGPLSLRQPAVREALEKLFDERFGTDSLAALKEAFRSANPGQLEESAGSRMVSRLSGLLREKKIPSESEVASLKGMDFHAALYDRLREKEVVGEDRMRALGQARGDLVLAQLQAAGVSAERLRLQPPQQVESTDGLVVMKFELTSARNE